jgi:hypothetical protein
MKLTVCTFDRFYNGQEIQKMLGEIPTTAKNIGYNCALNGMDWGTAKSEHPCEWDEYADYFLQAEKQIKEGLLFFKVDGLAVKVIKDGNSFCCVGEGFVNLQESDNYAFGDTFDEAIENYKKKTIA